ncbi:hypothetical protein AM380_14085 [Morganella morganii]|uniref:Uncharacterized protein n=1 Tax=Morganella morganii TaxID=582 RepID=A0AAU8ZNT2_MORMO|nr:hypothetical protein AM380_14085 [Morganella morganii]
MSLLYSNALIVANGKKPHTALVLNDNEVIDTVAAYMKKGRTCRPLGKLLFSTCGIINQLYYLLT